MLVLLPFPFILHIELVVDLHASALFDAVHPFSSVEVTVCVEHRASAVRDAVELFSLVTVWPGISDALHGLSLRVYGEDSGRSLDLTGGSLAFALSLDELGLFGGLRFVGSWAVFAAAHSKKKHIVMIWQGLWRIIIIMDVAVIKSEFG